MQQHESSFHPLAAFIQHILNVLYNHFAECGATIAAGSYHLYTASVEPYPSPESKVVTLVITTVFTAFLGAITGYFTKLFLDKIFKQKTP